MEPRGDYYTINPRHTPRRTPSPAAGLHCVFCGTTNLPRNVYWPKRVKVRVGFGQTIDDFAPVIVPICTDCHTDQHIHLGPCRHEAATTDIVARILNRSAA